MADHYKLLTEDEKAYWDIYARLRDISDWSGFSEGQAKIKTLAREWLVNQRKTIWRVAQPKSKGGDGRGWKHLNRAARYEQLREESLNNGTCRRICALPSNGNTPAEKAGIAERRMWWRVGSVDKQTRAWRQANADWCTTVRRSIYTLANKKGQGGWNRAERQLRYDNLCVATRTGEAYRDWAKEHDVVNGHEKPKPKPKPHLSGGRGRDACVNNMRRYLGTSEHPPGSNRGDPQPNGWQRRVIGATGYAWCACFATCMAWDAGVKGAGSAAVYGCYSLARQGAGIYRGVTTDPSRVRHGDHAVIGSLTTHIETVASDDNAMHCIGGNSGNAVRENYRTRGQIVCWLLVDYN